jgi:hypothetical protein
MVAPLSNPTAPNPNKLMAQLRMMPDQQLFQYAQMHKNDPYIFPMAFQESNTRKQMRAAQNTQAPPAPKVVDKNLQEMAQPMPEDQGIATLPTPNMQNMAGGGIVAFDDGGEVPGYAGGTLVDQIEAANQMSLRNTGFPLSPAQRARLEQTIKSNIAQEAAGREAAKAGRPFNPSAPRLSTNRDKMEAEREKNMAEVNRGTVNLRPTPSADPRLLGATPPEETVQSAPARTGGSDVMPSRPKLVEPATPQEGGLAALASKPEDLQRIYGNMVPPAADQFEGRIRAIGELEQANAARDLAQRRKDIEELGPAYTEREAKLKARQGRLETEEGKLPYMALIEAGLTMMGGTSPHAFVNIGAGGATGLKSYKQGIDKISDAKDRLDDAFGRIEEARRGEKVLNAKELRELESNVRKTVSQTEKDVLAGAQQAYGLANQQAGKMFDAYVANKRSEFEQVEATKRSRYEQDQQNKRTVMTTNAPTGLERILGNPVLFKRYMESQTGPANVRAESALRKEWAENPMVRQQYPKIDDYLMANGVGGQAGVNDGTKILGSRPIN